LFIVSNANNIALDLLAKVTSTGFGLEMACSVCACLNHPSSLSHFHLPDF
jgi:hypothetical protein